jgi:hypothetical protein
MRLVAKRIMKKLVSKILRRRTPVEQSRITNDTVAEHRERILAGGRRFKYPIQYARHKLVFNAIIISIVALAVIMTVGYWQLYPAQNNSEFMYRVTKVLPLPVAYVDGEPVPYSDYLMKYLSSVHYLEQKEQVSLKSDDGKRRVEYIKQSSMDDAIADAYARKLAAKLHITVSDVEVEAFLKSQRQSTDGEVSQQTYDAVVLDYYGWNPDEYRYEMTLKILRQKVTYAVDTNAKAITDALNTQVKTTGANLQAISAEINKTEAGKVIYGSSGMVPKTNQDGGLAIAATSLMKGSVSDAIKSTSGEGYYYVRLLDSNDTQVSYDYIQIPLKTFTQQLKTVINDNKVNRLISVAPLDTKN